MNQPRPIAKWAAIGGALAFAVPLAVYLVTLPPGLTWAHDGTDGGDLIAAAQTLGIPHPPGYPLYTLLARLFLFIPWGTPAHRVALLSAVAGAGAAFALFHLIKSLVGPERWPLATSGALLWAFAPVVWGQSVIAEVYALSALLSIGFLALFLQWRQTDKPMYWLTAWLVFGLGLAHQPLIAAFLFPAALLFWERRRHLNAQHWVGGAAMVACGLLFYLYLPLRAAASPAINWGEPRSLSGFWWVVSAAPYHGFAFGLPLVEWPSRIAAWARLLVAQFGVWGIALGLWGAMALHERDRRLSWGLLGAFALVSVYAVGYNTTDSYVYLLPPLGIFAAWIAVGVGDLWTGAMAWAGSAQRWVPVGAAALLLALPLAPLGMNWAASDLSADREAQTYVDAALEQLPPEAVVLANGDAQTFALWYARWALSGSYRGEVISVPLLQLDWYRQQVAERNPRLALPDATLTSEEMVARLVQENGSDFAILVTDAELAARASLAVTPRGPLFEVQSP